MHLNFVRSPSLGCRVSVNRLLHVRKHFRFHQIDVNLLESLCILITTWSASSAQTIYEHSSIQTQILNIDKCEWIVLSSPSFNSSRLFANQSTFDDVFCRDWLEWLKFWVNILSNIKNTGRSQHVEYSFGRNDLLKTAHKNAVLLSWRAFRKVYGPHLAYGHIGRRWLQMIYQCAFLKRDHQIRNHNIDLWKKPCNRATTNRWRFVLYSLRELRGRFLAQDAAFKCA